MKLKYSALALAFALALALTGCSANRDVDHSAPMEPTNNASSGDNGRPSAEVGGAQNSPGVNNGHDGAGGVIDDIGDAAGDVVQGAGNAVEDVGDAIGDAANGAGRAMH